PGAIFARRTRTIGMCSSDARSKGQPWPLPRPTLFDSLQTFCCAPRRLAPLPQHDRDLMNIKDYLEKKRIEVDRFLDQVTPPAATPPTTLHESTRDSLMAGCDM